MAKKSADTKQAAIGVEPEATEVVICRDPNKVVPPASPASAEKVENVIDHREPGAVDASKVPAVAPEDRLPELPPQPTDVTPAK